MQGYKKYANLSAHSGIGASDHIDFAIQAEGRFRAQNIWVLFIRGFSFHVLLITSLRTMTPSKKPELSRDRRLIEKLKHYFRTLTDWLDSKRSSTTVSSRTMSKRVASLLSQHSHT
jgi:hypothetical protein